MSFVVGSCLSFYLPSNNFGLIIWLQVGIVSMIGALSTKSKLNSITLSVIAGFIIGLWRCAPVIGDTNKVTSMTGKNVIVNGIVAADVDEYRPGEYRFYLKDFAIDSKGLEGSIWIETKTKLLIERNDTLRLLGKLSKGFGSYSASLKQAEVVSLEKTSSRDVGLQLRNKFSASVRQNISDPESSLGLGFLVGQKNSLPNNLEETLRIAGLTHIIVASGYNLTILVRLARRLFMKISKFMATSMAFMMIFGFIFITGWSPSMMRAGLVSSISLLAWHYGRKVHPAVLISFVAALSIFINPSYAAGDLGWQLSFASFAGVMILAPLLQRYFYGDDKPSIFRQIIGETLSAYIMTLPLILASFGALSSVALFANILVLPLIPFAMGLTFTTGILGYVSTYLAQIVGSITSWLLQYMVNVASYFASFSWSQVAYVFNGLEVAVWYLVVFLVCIYMKRSTGYRLLNSNIAE